MTELTLCVHAYVCAWESSSFSDNELDEDVREPLTEEEAELRAYLLHGEALSENVMDKYTSEFWDMEPYKWVCDMFVLK